MERHYKIHWKKGLDITPEIFVDLDNFHISERNLLGCFVASCTCGILPDSNFYIEKSIDNDRIRIQHLECLALTVDGYPINIQRDTHYQKELNLQDSSDSEYYVVLMVDPYSTSQLDEKGLHACPAYNLVLHSTTNPVKQGIPILKLIRNYSAWEFDQDYIPPSIALSSVDDIMRRYAEINYVINTIIRKLPEDNPLFFHIMMLQLELQQFTSQESPKEFILLLKKFCHIFQLYLKSEKNRDYIPEIKSFIDEKYNHLEIGKLMKLGYDCVTTVNENFDEKPEPALDEIKI
jgi:hypothetical protein